MPGVGTDGGGKVGWQVEGEREQQPQASSGTAVRWRRIVPRDTWAPARVHQTGGSSLQVARR